MKTAYTLHSNQHAISETIHKDMILLRFRIHEQRKFFSSGKTRDPDFRKNQLKALRGAVVEYTDPVLQALRADLGKPAFEAYGSEIAFLLQEIDHTRAGLKKWASYRRAGTPWMLRPALSRIVPEPYGTALIIGPWNYPFQLIIAPLISAIAAGNTAVLKTSEFAANTSRVVAEMIAKNFEPGYVTVAEGGVETAKFLLSEKFEYIFFTGGTEAGKTVMEAAVKNLTPVTLELGGKSPAIVEADASLDAAARRIAWGKFLNAGQTCVAPDYVLVNREVEKEFTAKLIGHIKSFYGPNPAASPDYGRIVNERHFRRIIALMKSGRIIHGGNFNEKNLYIQPTLVEPSSLGNPLMKEEIFGPVLPVIPYRTFDDAVSIVRRMPKPLALYFFSKNRKKQNEILERTSSGGVVLNDVIVHAANYNLPFGGVGASGIGAYHGRFGFETFSHLKPVMRRSTIFTVSALYPPYRKGVKFLQRIFG